MGQIFPLEIQYKLSNSIKVVFFYIIHSHGSQIIFYQIISEFPFEHINAKLLSLHENKINIVSLCTTKEKLYITSLTKLSGNEIVIFVY